MCAKRRHDVNRSKSKNKNIRKNIREINGDKYANSGSDSDAEYDGKHWKTSRSNARGRGRGKGKGRRGGEQQLSLEDEEYRDLEKQLERIGLTINPVVGDGNCLFRAIADQLLNDQRKHSQYREACVRFMQQNADYFSPFVVDCTLEDYCGRMKREGRWGGNLELQAIAMCFHLNIVIHQPNAPAYVIESPKKDGTTIHLAYHLNEHYNSVRPIRDDDGIVSAKSMIMSSGGGNGPHVTSGSSTDEPTKMESIVMKSTGCDDLLRIRRTLNDNWHDMGAAIEQILEEMNKEVTEQGQQEEVSEHSEQSNAALQQQRDSLAYLTKKERKRREREQKSSSSERRPSSECGQQSQISAIRI